MSRPFPHLMAQDRRPRARGQKGEGRAVILGRRAESSMEPRPRPRTSPTRTRPLARPAQKTRPISADIVSPAQRQKAAAVAARVRAKEQRRNQLNLSRDPGPTASARPGRQSLAKTVAEFGNPTSRRAAWMGHRVAPSFAHRQLGSFSEDGEAARVGYLARSSQMHASAKRAHQLPLEDCKSPQVQLPL
jgi:hypothetical protein